MSLPVWKGNTQLQEQPNSPVFENNKDGPRYTRIWVGPYATCLASIPARLSSIAGSPPGYLVDIVRVERAPGNKGMMTVTLTPAPIQDWTFGDNETLEVEWVELQKKIEAHPMFRTADSESSHPNAGKYPLNDDDLDKIEEWKNAGTASLRSSAYSALSDNAKALVDRLKRGQDTYVVYAPVARRTTKFSTKAGNTRCGFLSNPPGDAAVAGYLYLKTADRSTRDRNWTRSEEWTGADEIDTEIYAG